MQAENFIPADDQRLEYSDYATLEFVAAPVRPAQKIARLRRPLSSPGRGYEWDNPGARLRFATDAKEVIVHLYYSDKHISASARNPVGVYCIDGKTADGWKFASSSRATVRKPENVDVKMAVAGDGKIHDYEVIMPYGDSVDVVGISVTPEAKFGKPSPRPAFRCAFYGDSITHGFTAGDVSGTYVFKVAQINNWQLINLGIGGNGSSAADAGIIGKIDCDMLVTLIGVNDWQGGRPVAAYKQNIKQFIAIFRKLRPTTPMAFITPLWVPATWQPKTAKFSLEDYRQALREAVKEAGDSAIQLIEGPELIDHDAKFFDPVAVHPNNSGFDMMADRLAKKLSR